MKMDDDTAVIHISQVTAPKFKEWIAAFWTYINGNKKQSYIFNHNWTFS
jgi:hypothetical protein